MPPPPVLAPVSASAPVPALVPPPPMRLSPLCLTCPAHGNATGVRGPYPTRHGPCLHGLCATVISAACIIMCQEGRRAEGQTGMRKGAEAEQLQKKLEVSKKIVLSEDPDTLKQ